MSFYTSGNEWHRSHAHEKKMNEDCAICGDRHLKSNMYKLYVVLLGYSTPKKWCCVCENCIANVADLLGKGIGGTE